MQFTASLLSAIYLGLLTSISPCPLATNIAGISYISKRITHPVLVLLTGFIYTFGRTLTYVLLSVIIVKSLSDIPILSHILQKYMNKVIGPFLILVGMFLLELIQLNINISFVSDKLGEKIQKTGFVGAFILGIIFALSFCPTSAAFFFGGLIPLATQNDSSFIIPLFYGISTGIPVIVFAFLISFGTSKIGKAFNFLSSAEFWARKVPGCVLIIVGIYLTLINIFKLQIDF